MLANGAFTFEPPGTQRPKTRERDALAKGRSTLRAAERGAKAEVFFGLFRASAPPERDPASGQLVPVFDARPVWVVHYRDVPSTRAAPITIRPRVVSTTSVAGTVLETTTSTSTTVEPFHTDILVVFDDRTGAQILRSEFASESVR